jgi:hypothetical protein
VLGGSLTPSIKPSVLWIGSLMKIINSLRIFEKVGTGVLKEAELSFDIYIPQLPKL